MGRRFDLPSSGDGSVSEGVTKEELQALVGDAVSEAIESNNKSWQSLMTREQQKRSKLDREVAEMRGVITTMSSNPPTHEPPPAGDEVTLEEWEGMSTSKETFGGLKRMIRQEIGASQADPELAARVDETSRSVSDMQLAQDKARMQSMWPWMEQDHVEAVLQASVDAQNYDILYVAEKLYGAPGENPGGSALDDDGDDVTPTPRVRRPTTLGGSGSGSGGGGTPRTVNIRRGMHGYSDVVKHGVQWAKDTGRT